jgi:RimJ/RimL family protein N-acetyltransferase
VEGGRQILPERIEGDGVLLRRWMESDAEALARAVEESLDHLRPWMDFVAQEPQSLEERRARLRDWQREWLAGGSVVLGVFVGDEVAGGCGLHRRLGPSALEIGYWIHPSFTNQGLATQVVGLLTGAALSLPGITHVEIHVDKANSASLAVPRRLGFRFLGEHPDAPSAPAEVGIECVWRMEDARWRECFAG